MNNQTLLGMLFIVLLLGDVVLIMMRIGLGNVRRAQLIAGARKFPKQHTRLLILLEQQSRVSAALRFAHYAFRMAALGSLLLLGLLSSPFLDWRLIVSLVIGMWAWALLEFWLEGLVLRNPGIWALRLSGWALIIWRIFSLFTLLPPVRFRGQVAEQSELEIMAEIKSLVAEGQKEGVLEQEERQMIDSVFQFHHTLAREVMVPRMDMLALDVDTPPMEALDALLESGYSRVPVYQHSVDNILGLLYVKDWLEAFRKNQMPEELKPLLRQAYFVPEAKKVDQLLTELQARHIHMAIVIDEYGGVAGLVTLEDLVEEIVGEIQDEYDAREEQPYRKISEDEILFLGRIDLDDFNQIMHTNLPADEADTLGGFMYTQIGRVPSGGEQVQQDGLILTVSQVVGRRIREVQVCKKIPANTIIEEASHADE